MADKPNLGWECPCCKKTWSPSTTGCMACNYPWDKTSPDPPIKAQLFDHALSKEEIKALYEAGIDEPKSEETNNQDGDIYSIFGEEEFENLLNAITFFQSKYPKKGNSSTHKEMEKLRKKIWKLISNDR